MPRYHFDFIDAGVIEPDEVGTDLPDLEAAIDEAHIRLAEMRLVTEPGHMRPSPVMQVRDGPDSPVVTVLAPLSADHGHGTSNAAYLHGRM